MSERIGRPAPFSAPAKQWPEGGDFVTRVTRREGIVLQVRAYHVTVAFENPANPDHPEVKRIHPNVVLEEITS